MAGWGTVLSGSHHAKRCPRASTAAVLAVLANSQALAHPGHDHKIMGTVTMAVVDYLMIKMPDGSWKIRHSHTSSRPRRPAQ